MATALCKQIGGVMKFDHPILHEIGSRIRPPDSQISSKSDDFLLRYGDLIIFKMTAVRHLEFLKIEI